MSRLRNLVGHRVIVDRAPRLGRAVTGVAYECGLVKEEVARRHLLDRRPRGDGSRLEFLDLGAGEGNLDYLLDIDRNLTRLPAPAAEANRTRFNELYNYTGLELTASRPDFVGADICSLELQRTQPKLREGFDAVYSNNVFEHLRRPWIAAENIVWLLRPGGICITIAPFSLRYHESPADYFRYTHTGLASLFEDTGKARTLESGYDTTGRRNDWQGSGATNDACPEDHFGAWRENWFTVAVIEKAT
jgi:SAM-dependent methyltransferase